MSGEDGIVRTYEGRGDARSYTGLPHARHYAARYRQGQARPVLEMDAVQAGEEASRRVACYREEHPHADYQAALRIIFHDDQDLQRAARPLSPEHKPDQAQSAKAARHMDERAAHFVRTGEATSLTQAHKLACRESPKIAKLAGAQPPVLGVSEGGKIYSRVTGLAYEWKEDTVDQLNQPVTRPPKLSDAQQKLKALTEADVVELLVTVPKRGELVNWRPWLREWCFLTLGPYPIGSAPKGIKNVDNVNALNEKIWQAARQERLRRFGFTD